MTSVSKSLMSTLKQIACCKNPEECKKIMAESCGSVVDHMRIVAACYVRLKEIAPDIDLKFTSQMERVLEKIHSGSLRPELVTITGISEDSRLLKRAMSSPPEVQETIIDDGSFEIAEAGTDEIRSVRAVDLSNREIDQLFHDSGVRTLSQQRAWIRDQQFRAATKNKGDDSKYEYNRRRGVVHIKRECVLTKKELATMLADLEK
jgi:hypothetical protein